MNNGCPDGKLCLARAPAAGADRNVRRDPGAAVRASSGTCAPAGGGRTRRAARRAPSCRRSAAPTHHVVVEAERQAPDRATPRAGDGSIGTSTSTRRSRLRGIRSAEPMRWIASATAPATRVRSGPSAITLPWREPIDPAVLEVAAEDAADADVLGQTRHAGAQAADAAHEQVDLRSGLARRVEGVDDVLVGDRVALQRDASRRSRTTTRARSGRPAARLRSRGATSSVR